MQVICLEDAAFYQLVHEVVERLRPDMAQPKKWLNDEEAMELLSIKAKSTLQKLRDEGRIRFSQPAKKMILYDRDSILAYIDRHARKPFNA